ncbi:MAG: MMPL family transporter [Candidatus Omnitrophica bacterium]|nr:MMPL family transporter [Candidatus Omnitrophota bacterium]
MKFQFFRKYSPFAYFARLSKESRSLCAFFAALIFSAILLSQLVNLTPQVGSDFFFSSDNPKFQYARLIGKIFPQEATQLVISAKGDIYSEDYLERMRVLTDMTILLPGVSGVVSLTSGPRNIRDAAESPLWKRLLISDDGASSNMLAFLENVSPERIIPKFETLIGLLESPRFDLQIAGVPYVVEMIRRNLVHDLVLFSLVAFAVFGTVMVFIFRSLRVFVGTFISCLEACILTLLIVGLSGIKIGILTVNLATIVFVLTLSHIIFLTHNWRTINRTRPGSYDTSSREAVRMTFGASFWCMMTTLLGFLSLLFVEAKPLRELGISGAVGTLVSISAAYGIYPLFLKTVRPSAVPREGTDRERARAFFIRRTGWIAGLVLILCAVCLPGLVRLNTDPSLFSFFKKGSRLREGLEYIDRNGGSSPLDIVVRDAKGARLNTNPMYERMWDLQEALEKDSSVGSVISLPVLMAEGGRAPLAFLLTWESLLKWMDKPQYNKIARSFITDDHVSGHFLLRMKESGRTTSRIEVVERLKMVVRKHGFVNEMAGGLFLLQGELAKLVSSSLVFGLARLIAFFVVISFIVSRSLRISLAMVFSLSVIPVCVLGGMGLLRVPVDIISAPAVNIAIGMGIDSMIHLVTAVRRRRSRGMDLRAAWLQSRARLWKPILGSMFIVSAGFAIFTLSAFPPTQRFGLSIVLGTMLASVSTVFILPLIANIGLNNPRKNPPFRLGPRLGKTRPDEVLTR